MHNTPNLTLVICPLKKELQLLAKALESQGWIFSQGNTGQGPYRLSSEKGLALSVGGVGKRQFANQTRHLVEHFGRVREVILLGSGGGISHEVSVGDVVIGSQIIDLDMNAAVLAPSPDLAARFQTAQANFDFQLHRDFQLHYGPIVSMQQNVTDSETADRAQLQVQDLLGSQTQALAVGWEGAGGAAACQSLQLPFLEIRAVTDDARNQVAESFNANLPMAMAHAGLTLNMFFTKVVNS